MGTFRMRYPWRAECANKVARYLRRVLAIMLAIIEGFEQLKMRSDSMRNGAFETDSVEVLVPIYVLPSSLPGFLLIYRELCPLA